MYFCYIGAIYISSKNTLAVPSPLATSVPLHAIAQTITDITHVKPQWAKGFAVEGTVSKVIGYRLAVAHSVGRGIAVFFHDRGIRRRWVVSSTLRPHFNPGKETVPIV